MKKKNAPFHSNGDSPALTCVFRLYTSGRELPARGTFHDAKGGRGGSPCILRTMQDGRGWFMPNEGCSAEHNSGTAIVDRPFCRRSGGGSVGEKPWVSVFHPHHDPIFSSTSKAQGLDKSIPSPRSCGRGGRRTGAGKGAKQMYPEAEGFRNTAENPGARYKRTARTKAQ